MLSLGEKTLQNKLRARGTSFRLLVGQVRQSIARQHLRQSTLSIIQLAYKLGYSELSAFTLAFKRWFGIAPSKMKLRV
ncbi:MAG: helix-turn-helix domain-containing protein [Proteobacteria bacterium]|nr:helix-turn-helix domain-containing protein [Pseudomonadota bacterium]